MSEYQLLSLGQICSLIKDGTHGTHPRQKDGIPLISAKDVQDGRITISSDTSRISREEYETIHRTYEIQEDDLLISLVGSIGRCALVTRDHGTFSAQRSVGILRSDRSRVDPKYLYHATCDYQFQQQLLNRSKSTAQAGVYLGELAQCSIPLPPLPEQKKIAEILSGIDELIIKKEKQICALEHLEKGVLDALTDQKLREGVRCVPLSEIVSPDRKITYGIVQAGPDIKGGIPYIRVTDMSDDELDVNKMLRTSPEIAAKFKRSEVKEGDIVVALRGIIGATHLIDERTSGANLTQGTALLSSSEKCLPLYVNTILKSQFCKEQFSLLSKGSTIVEITLSSLATLSIPLPSINAQAHIADSIASIRHQIVASRKSLASTKNMKSAVASDLLSGRKRVSI